MSVQGTRACGEGIVVEDEGCMGKLGVRFSARCGWRNDVVGTTGTVCGAQGGWPSKRSKGILRRALWGHTVRLGSELRIAKQKPICRRTDPAKPDDSKQAAGVLTFSFLQPTCPRCYGCNLVIT